MTPYRLEKNIFMLILLHFRGIIVKEFQVICYAVCMIVLGALNGTIKYFIELNVIICIQFLVWLDNCNSVNINFRKQTF